MYLVDTHTQFSFIKLKEFLNLSDGEQDTDRYCTPTVPAKNESKVRTTTLLGLGQHK